MHSSHLALHIVQTGPIWVAVLASPTGRIRASGATAGQATRRALFFWGLVRNDSGPALGGRGRVPAQG